jgi:hypothetical protein
LLGSHLTPPRLLLVFYFTSIAPRTFKYDNSRKGPKPLAGIVAVIDLKNETMLSLAEAAKRLPPHRLGRPVHSSCLFRWIFDGVKLPSGERIRLEAIRLGGRWLTSVEALQKFAEAQTPAIATKERIPLRSAARRTRAAERAAQLLDRSGI